MNSSGKRISAGWSFVGGTVLGALAVVGLTGSIHVAGARAGRSGSQRPVAAASDVRRASNASIPAGPDANAPRDERKVPGHSELDLQLD